MSMKMRSTLRSIVLAAGIVAGVSAGASSDTARTEMTFVRLTPEQYQNTIRNIFGPGIEVEANTVEAGFRDEGLLAIGARKLTLSSAGFERYETIAQRIAAQVFEPRRVATFLPCAPAAKDRADDACAAQFVERVGPLLFRRPMADGETASYVAVARAAAGKLGGFHAGMAAALVQMLVAPEFLLRAESGAPDAARPDTARLDAYSAASRLSFFLWDSAPDRQLLAAAESGSLLTPKGLAREVDRLLGSPRIEYGIRAFFSDMLGFDQFATLSKDTNIFPKFTKLVEEDGREQTLRTVVDQMMDKSADYRDLFVTRETFLTPSLAAIYGVPLPRTQELGGAVPWVPYTFPEGDRHVGLLTHVSFLSLHSHAGRTSPTLRGKALRENILCQKVPPPPSNVDFTTLDDASNPNFRTVRQRLTAHRANPVCAGCHRITDPIGLALETFDSAGVARTTENGAPIDVTGELNGKPFDGVVELAGIIRNDPAATSCFITRAYSYGASRRPTSVERAWLTRTHADLRETGVTWREVMRRIALNPDFYTNPVAPPEATQAAAASAASERGE